MKLPPHLLQTMRLGVALALTACSTHPSVKADPTPSTVTAPAAATVGAPAPMGMTDPELAFPLKPSPIEAPSKPPAKVSKRKPVMPPPSKIDPCMACGMG